MFYIISMTIVDLNEQTHKKLIQVKQKMRKKNPTIYKINNNTTINHALTRIEENEDYEVKPTN